MDLKKKKQQVEAIINEFYQKLFKIDKEANQIIKDIQTEKDTQNIKNAQNKIKNL